MLPHCGRNPMSLCNTQQLLFSLAFDSVEGRERKNGRHPCYPIKSRLLYVDWQYKINSLHWKNEYHTDDFRPCARCREDVQLRTLSGGVIGIVKYLCTEKETER